MRMAVLPLLRERLAALAQKYRVPGAEVAVYAEGEAVATQLGELEYHGGQPVDADTAFPVGSITKAFTASLAMTLVADGDLDLDGPLDEHLPELAELGQQVTLRQLLSHTAGLANGPASEEVAGFSARRYLADHCGPHNIVAPPGTAFSYSNLGYVLVGRLIEAITGMTWEEAIQAVLLRPLHIEPAFVVDDLDPDGGCPERPVAVGHSVNLTTGRTRAVPQSLAPAEAPAGGLALSALDLITLASVYLGRTTGRVLPPEYAAQMCRPVPGADPYGLAEGWGLGLATFGDGWVGHDGNAYGTSCYLRIAPERGSAVALTSNANSGSGLWPELLAELADDGILEVPAAPDWQQEPVVPAPAECAGRYVNGDVEYLVEVCDGDPYLAVDDADLTRLTCHEDLTFSTRDPASGRHVLGGRFLPGPSGEVAAVMVGGRLGRRVPVPAGRYRSA
jgi:CubicO group peptidase (beta-lactamase class C family)